jgi:D-glycero-alpha-D-manno-heptose-7-phosphate kinase
MITIRSPLRITLGGGGTDLPSYYNKHEGFVLSAAIDKYVYVSLLKTFARGINLKYSKMENVQELSDVKHPIMKEVLNYFKFEKPKIEITSFADIPSGTGLGSSGSFTTALIKSVAVHKRINLSQSELAELACYIEIEKLGEPIGKQDQYIAAYGGLTQFTFKKDNKVKVEPLDIDQDTIYDLQDNLVLFFTGFSRSASNILNDQNVKSKKNDEYMIENLHYVKDLGFKIKEALKKKNTNLFGELMLDHWEHKKKRSSNMSNAKIDEWYELGIKNGAIGGKVVGAGGGGFLMFYAHNKNLLRETMNKVGLEEVRFKFDFEGTKTILI